MTDSVSLTDYSEIRFCRCLCTTKILTKVVYFEFGISRSVGMTSGFFRRQFVLSYRAPATTIQWLFSQAVNDRDHAGQISCRRQVDDCTIVAAQRNDVASLNNAYNVFHRSHASIAEAM